MKTIAAFIIGLILTVACNVSNAHAQESDDIAVAVAVASAVTNGLFTPGSASEAKGCLNGNVEDCIDVLLAASTVVDIDLAYQMRTIARRLCD